ncbi:hypothetical protein ACH0CA_10070 [Kytococcus sedentarius]|uniref:hypothetical protein n=1 Tax=Kytococcus sedentarius TaxID=1276 RepID=UPI00387A2FFC
MHTHRALVASALAGGILLTPTAALALDVPARRSREASSTAPTCSATPRSAS